VRRGTLFSKNNIQNSWKAAFCPKLHDIRRLRLIVLRTRKTGISKMKWSGGMTMKRGNPNTFQKSPSLYHLDQNPTRTFSRTSTGLRVTGWLLHARASTGRTSNYIWSNNLFKNSVPNLKRTQSLSSTKTKKLLLYCEIIWNTQIRVLCVGEMLLDVKVGGHVE
jgi:hypothetical protein